MKLLKSLAAKLHFFVETIRDFMFYIMLCIMLMYTKKNTKTTMKKGNPMTPRADGIMGFSIILSG